MLVLSPSALLRTGSLGFARDKLVKVKVAPIMEEMACYLDHFQPGRRCCDE
jgi:hypothetical protein